MMLTKLIEGLPVKLQRGPDADIRFATLDSRTVGPGALFAAVVNPLRNGEGFVADALSRGASAILAEREMPTGDAAFLLSDRVADALGTIAHRLHADPTKDMSLIGVTGTNGKTSFTYLMESILAAAGEKVGVMGTISHRFGGKTVNAQNTTPESPDLAALLAEMRDAGTTSVVMEASSHGLALSRVAGCRFRTAVFTNLTRDHMDFHISETDYLNAKLRLFSEFLDANHPQGAFALINADQAAAPAFLAASKARTVTYGRAGNADYRVESARADQTGVRIRLVTPKGAVDVVSPLLGDFQIENVTAACATALELGVPRDLVLDGIAKTAGVPGRMEPVPADGFLVLVDYAHTPDALANVVAAGRKLATGRLITLFGCGGDRDKGKRPLMAQAAASASDVVIVTSDNPRTEAPSSIIEDILTGLNLSAMDHLSAFELADYAGRRGLFVEEDRKAAVEQAVLGAREGDVILLVGKGHEDYQIRGRQKFHLDDREEAAAAVALRRARVVREEKVDI